MQRNDKNKRKIKGLGDAIKVVTDTLGIEQCAGCIERQNKLNKLFPFKTPRVLTDEEYSYLDEVFSWYNGLPIPAEKIETIKKCEQIWLRAFNVKTEGCKSCGATYQNNYMNDLKILYENGI